MLYSRSFLLTALSVVLASCGGGGDSTPAAPVASASSFPLAAGYRAVIQAGNSLNFQITGTCGGTATQTNSAATGSTAFEGQTVATSTTTQQLSLTGCTPASIASTTTSYISQTTFLPIGMETVGTEYVVAQAIPGPLAATVKVGDTATVATWNVYPSSAKSSVRSTRTGSYVVSADTASTALVTLIQREVTGGAVTLTQQSLYRIDAAGNLTLISIDVVTATTHLILTRA